MSLSEPSALFVRIHIESLLYRYPDLPPGELDELLTFLASGPAADCRILRRTADLRPIIDRIAREHPGRFSPRVPRTMIVTALAIAPLALAWRMIRKSVD